jgi:hypothetical protein
LTTVAERRLDRLAALVVLIAPAEIADRADIDPGRLERIGGVGPANQARCGDQAGTGDQ